MSLPRSVASIYFLAVVAYTTWAVMEGRGLPGWMTGWLLARFDWSSNELTGGLTALLLLWPLVALRKRLAFDRPSSRGERSLMCVFLLVAPALLGIWGRSYLIHKDTEETEMRLLTHSLVRNPLPLLDPGRHLVRLEGGYLPSQAQHYIQDDYGEDHTHYIPFVGSAQSTSTSMVVVLKTRGDAVPFIGSSGQISPLLPDAPFLPATLDGIAESGKLPVYVERAWEDDGFTLASPYYLVEPRILVDGRLPSRLGYLRPDLALCLGLGFSASVALCLALLGLSPRRAPR